MATLKLEVRQEHIDQGIQGDNDLCPIALALKDTPDQTSRDYKITKRLDRWISKFDKDRFSVKPETFTVRESLNPVGIHKINGAVGR